MPLCEHLKTATFQEPSTHLCQECVELGDRWIHLRMCLKCGHVGCCDDSKNRHATKHFQASGHPVIRSIEPGERWGWCYLDRAFVPDASRV